MVGHSHDGVTTKRSYGVDVYDIDHPWTPSFSIGLVKSEYESINQFRLTWEDEH